MDVKKLGMIAASTVTILAANVSLAGGKDAPYCVPTKAATTDCKGHGIASCKGSNTCSYQGHIDAKNKAGCEKKGGAWMNQAEVAKALAAAKTKTEAAPAATPAATPAPTAPH